MKSNKLKVAFYFLFVFATIAFVCILAVLTKNKTERVVVDNQTFAQAEENIEIKIGDHSIKDYKIIYGLGTKKAADRVRDLIYAESGVLLPETMGEYDLSIVVKKDKENSGFSIVDGKVIITGKNPDDCVNQVNIFANTYLGYSFAGESREHILENVSYVNIPANYDSNEDDSWVKKREPIICLWKTDTVRGIYCNPNVSLKSELMSYSNDQLYTYVKMMKQCGFTGIQVTDMCSTWAQYGGYEFVQDRIRYMADSAHSLGMDFTLWVWGSEFYGYGWVDKTVRYYDNVIPVQEAPECLETFDKYFSIYAKLADCSDRVIMHFYDPGNLYRAEDIAFYATKMRDKCKEINPDIDFGVNCYTSEMDLGILTSYLGNDITVYGGVPHTDDEIERYTTYADWINVLGARHGVWSWNLCEMEIDQLAEMNVNSQIIADTYKRTKDAGEEFYPEYWSEMDSYHLLNIFSLYTAEELLKNPEASSEEALRGACKELVGENRADDLYECISIIEDARSGEKWETFKNNYPEYLLISDDYPAEELLERCEKAIPLMEEMAAENLTENTLSLPIETSELINLIIPHLTEIKEYSEFRIGLLKAEEMLKNGDDPESIKKYVDKMYVPIHEYNTVTGCWGQAEQRAQSKMLEDFCKKAKIETPKSGEIDRYRKNLIYGEMCNKQECKDEIQYFSKESAYQLGVAFGNDETIRLVEEMLEEGILSEAPDGSVYISDWGRENLRFSFD